MVRVVVSIFFLSFMVCCEAVQTQTLLFRPFTEGAEHAQFKIKEVVKGSCYHQSKSMPREDAWQCKSNNTTYDPCFKQKATDKTLYCPSSPWDGNSTLIEADIIVDNEFFDVLNMGDHLPWAMLLDNGVICKRNLKQSMYDEQPVEYHCQDKSFLFGRLQRCREEWSMLRYDGDSTDSVIIRQAWY